jgi:hypothetical protein
MTEQTTSLVLEQLPLIRRSQDEMRNDIMDLKVRMSSVDEHVGPIQIQAAVLNKRIDRVDERLGRIERRLELSEA